MASSLDDHTGLRAPGFAGATGWLNGPPLEPPRWSDGVTLVDFFTYSCVNCLRTLPHVRQWHERYAALGLRVVGVHTPEFEFEADPNNVREFLREHGVNYPVALDAERRVWDRWANKFWPRKYLIDRAGRIRYDQIGEGDYGRCERAIRDRLIAEWPDIDLPGWNDAESDGASVGAYCVRPTPELFAGWYRGWSGQPGGWLADTAADYVETSPIEVGPLYLHGAWRVAAEYAEPAAAFIAGEVWATARFSGFEANAVMGVASGEPATARLTLDSEPLPQALAGRDVAFDAGGAYVAVTASRLYHLVRAPTAGPHTLRLWPATGLWRLYSLTYGGCRDAPAPGW